MADETNSTPRTMRERLIEAARLAIEKDKASDHMVSTPGEPVIEYDGAVDLGVVVDAMLAELANPDADTIQSTARAIGIADSGTDIEFIDEMRGSHITYTACAKAGIAAMVQAIRGEAE